MSYFYTLAAIVFLTMVARLVIKYFALHGEPVSREWLPRVPFVALGLAVVYTLLCSGTIISSGHEGVVSEFGKVRPIVLGEGLRPKAPWWVVTEQEVRMMVQEADYHCLTRDQQTVDLHMKINYRRLPGKTPMLIDEVHQDLALVEETIIFPANSEVLMAEVAHYKIAEILDRRAELKANVHTALEAWLEKYDLDLMEVSISNVDFSDKYDGAIEDKQEQEQLALQAEYQLGKAKTKAKEAVADAVGQAESLIAEARGRASAMVTEADAKAAAIGMNAAAMREAYAKLAATYNEAMLQRDIALKWDGKPQVLRGGEGQSPTILMAAPASENPVPPVPVN